MIEDVDTVREVAKAGQEIGKAVQEAAKTGRALIQPATDLGRWAAGVIGTVPEDLVGLAIGDYFQQLRIRNLDRVRRKTEEILRSRDVSDPEPIGPRLAIPVFEAASDESDETLQDLWARLLANAMDPGRGTDLRRQFIDVLRQFEPFDARFFQLLSDAPNQRIKDYDEIQEALGSRSNQVHIAVNQLSDLGCIGGIQQNGQVHMKPLGHEIRLALALDVAD